MERRLAGILVADVVGFSHIMGADEAGTLQRLKSLHKDLMQPRIKERKGRIVKLMGDGLLAEFSSVVEAIQCAVDIQASMVDREPDLPDDSRIRLRIGVNLGDIIVEGSDIYGDGINVAARLEGLAKPGGICISGKVYDEVRNKLPIAFEDLGEQEVKNIREPVRVYSWTDTVADPMPGMAGVEGALPLPDKPSVAVLPFANMSGDPDQDHFADGMAEDIITSSFTYKGRAVKVQEVAKELGVRYVLECSVRKAGNRVRITSQLIDCTTGGHLWAERFDRDLTDIFAVQDEVTQEIVSAMAVEMTADERERLKSTSTNNLEAYDYFLRGRKQYRLLSKEGAAQAEALLKRAIDLDPAMRPRTPTWAIPT